MKIAKIIVGGLETEVPIADEIYNAIYMRGKNEAILNQCNHDQAVKDAYEQGVHDRTDEIMEIVLRNAREHCGTVRLSELMREVYGSEKRG